MQITVNFKVTVQKGRDSVSRFVSFPAASEGMPSKVRLDKAVRDGIKTIVTEMGEQAVKYLSIKLLSIKLVPQYEKMVYTGEKLKEIANGTH